MKKKQLKPEPYMMNRELSWLKFNERVLNEAGNPRVPLAERLTFASIYQSNLDEFYMVRVGTLMDQMESSEVVRENKTNMTSKEQVKAIIDATRELDIKKAVIYEQLMGELEPQGIRIINFNKKGNYWKLTLIMKLHHICLRISSANSSRFHSYRIKRFMRLHCLQRRVERQKLRSFRVAIMCLSV